MRPGGDKLLALTRILHRSEDDELSPYVPTFRAQPLHPGGRCVACWGVERQAGLVCCCWR